MFCVLKLAIMKLQDALKELHQDGILWKAKRIWGPVKNPDEMAGATDGIVAMLAKIPSNIKRDAYTVEVAEAVSDGQPKNKRLVAGQLKTYLKDYLVKKEKESAKKPVRKKSSDIEAIKESLNLPEDFSGDVSEVLEFAIFEKEGAYYSKGMKNDWRQISNFTMRILFHVNTGGDAAYRLIAVKNIYGIGKTITINTDDLVSVSAFKKVLARQGDFLFSGTDIDLGRLSGLLQKDEKPTSFVEVLGHHSGGHFYSFANGVVDTHRDTKGIQFHEVDEYGIVSIRDESYFIPACSKMFINKEGLYQSEKRFVMQVDDKKNFATWSRLHRDAYQDKSIIGQMWSINALFRDITFRNNQLDCTPILCLAGQPSSGKGTFAKSLLRLMGEPQQPIGLGGQSTPKGFMRTFAQFKNAIVWLDEYKNNIPRPFIETIKNIYDGVSYTRAIKSNDFQTESLPVNSACLLSGQEIPTIEAALLSRTMLLMFTTREKGDGEDQYTNVERKAFDKMKAYEIFGISTITAEVLQFRHLISDQFAAEFDRQIQAVQHDLASLNLNDDRYIKNMALCLSLYKILSEHLRFSFTFDEAKATLLRNVERQFLISKGSNELAKFWQVVDHLIALKQVHPGQHFRFSNTGDQFLYVRIKDIYPLYVKEMAAQKDMNWLSKSSLEHYLRNDVECYVDYRKHRNVGGSDSLWVHVFRCDKLQDKYEISLSGTNMDFGESEPAPFIPFTKDVGQKSVSLEDDNDLPF